MVFTKGISGNPSGRPKVAAEIRSLAQQHGREAFERIVYLAASDDERIALAASQEILNRAYGKPPQAHAGEDGEGPVRHILEVVWVGRESKEPE
jgi:hypothetical protein